MDGLFGDGLVDDVLFCGGDSLEEDLRWGARLGALVDLVAFDDGVTCCGVALFKTVEALSRGAFFFSTSVELKTKGTGGGGAGHEIMNSNTSLPWILTPRHFLAVSAICFLLRKISFYLNLFLRQVFSAQLWLSDLYYHICDWGDNLLCSKIDCVAGRWW